MSMQQKSATTANVASSATVVDILVANPSRTSFLLHNDSSAILYLKFGSAATTTSYSRKIAAGEHYEMPSDLGYTGLVTGIWASANGSARVTEITA